MRRLVLVVATCAAAATAPALAGPVLDQTQELTNASFNMDAPIFEWQQGITVGTAGLLAQIDIHVQIPGSSTFYVNAGAPWQSDARDFELSFATNATGWHSIDVSGAGLNLDVGDEFVIGWDNTGGGLWAGGGFINGGDPYPDGELWLAVNDNPNEYVPGWELAFRTYMTPAPGTLGLLLVAAPFARRRRGG